MSEEKAVVRMSDKGVGEELTFGNISSIAKKFAESRIFGIKDENEMFAVMMIAHARGIHPALAAQQYDLIEGKLSMNSATMVSLFRHEGGSIKINERSTTVCDLEFVHPNGDTIPVRWTIEQARSIKFYSKKKGGYICLADKDVWKNYPRAMLWNRAVSEGVRAIMPELITGVYTPDEIEDYKDKPPPKTQVAQPVFDTTAKDIDADPALSNDSVFEGEATELPSDPAPPAEEGKRTRAGKNDITQAQIKKLMAALGGDNESKHAALKARFGLDSFKELTRDQASEWIEELESAPVPDPIETAETPGLPQYSDTEKAIRTAYIKKVHIALDEKGERAANIIGDYGLPNEIEFLETEKLKELVAALEKIGKGGDGFALKG